MPVADITAEFEKHSDNIIPRLTAAEIDTHKEIIKKARILSIDCDEAVLKRTARAERKN
jgi:hypothetical protein